MESSAQQEERARRRLRLKPLSTAPLANVKTAALRVLFYGDFDAFEIGNSRAIEDAAERVKA